MISQVSIKNFKCLRDVTVNLERFTVFVGANGSGKTSVIQALDTLSRAFQPVVMTEYEGNDPTPNITHILNEDVEAELSQGRSRGAKDAVEVAAFVRGVWCRYRTRSKTTPPEPAETGQAIWESGAIEAGRYPEHGEWRVWNIKDANPNPFPPSTLLQLEPSRLMRPRPAKSDPTVMMPDGTGMHSALANIALSEPETWQTLQDQLRHIVPSVRRLRHTMKGAKNSPSLVFDVQGADSLPADQVSEGTLLVLGLLTALHSPARPSLILLDDLDRGLHPKAQRELIGLLRGVLDSKPELQIVGSTHSPYMLGRMEPNEVQVTYLRDDGSTACEPLTHHPKFPTWKDEFHPGEMWSMFGEKWVAEQRDGRGDGSGAGYGDGSGDGRGDGSGAGYGDGSGDGSGAGSFRRTR